MGTRQGCLGSLLWCQNLLGKMQAAGEWEQGEARAGQGWCCRACTALPGSPTREWLSVCGQSHQQFHPVPCLSTILSCPGTSGRKCCPEEESKARQGRGRGYGWRSTGISRTLEQALPARGEGRALTDSLLPAPHHLLLPQLGKIKGAEPDSSCPAWPPGEELKAVSFRG